MKYFLTNPAFPDFFAKQLAPYGFCIPIRPFHKLDEPVNAHPDMLAVNIGGKLFIHADDIHLAAALSKQNIPFSLSQAPVGAKYPQDIALNLFTVKKYLFANVAHASADVLEYARLCEYELVNVAQGYAKCSTLLLDEAVITADTGIYRTADTGIYRAAKERGIDALLISPGNIGIEKYDTGFIGGASAKIAEGKVAVFGNIEKHPDGENILGFAKKHDTQIISLGHSALFDYGGIVCADA